MRRLATALLCAACAAACGGNSVRDAATTANSSNAAAASASPASPAQTTLAHGPSSAPGSVPPVASGHGAPPPAAGSAPSAPPSAAGGPDTSALDAKIEKAVARARTTGASEADKRAAAEAYMERGNVFWGAGLPALYKRALADFNSVLLYQPGNADAQAKRAEIIRIYQSLGRPVPDYSNEQ